MKLRLHTKPLKKNRGRTLLAFTVKSVQTVLRGPFWPRSCLGCSFQHSLSPASTLSTMCRLHAYQPPVMIGAAAPFALWEIQAWWRLVCFFLFWFNDKILLVTHNLTQNLLRLTESGIKTHLLASCIMKNRPSSLKPRVPRWTPHVGFGVVIRGLWKSGDYMFSILSWYVIAHSMLPLT